jgi:hypothetical protein
VVDMQALGERQITIDCDVLQADGGTRTASITGACVAVQALDGLVKAGKLPANPMRDFVAAISVGIYKGVPVLDLDYLEDSDCETDMNVVMTGSGGFVEVQGTAEGSPSPRRTRRPARTRRRRHRPPRRRTKRPSASPDPTGAPPWTNSCSPAATPANSRNSPRCSPRWASRCCPSRPST